jgi:hypothetical protein
LPGEVQIALADPRIVGQARKRVRLGGHGAASPGAFGWGHTELEDWDTKLGSRHKGATMDSTRPFQRERRSLL